MKNLLKLGKALNKAEQKEIMGGRGLGGLVPELCDESNNVGRPCETDAECCGRHTCVYALIDSGPRDVDMSLFGGESQEPRGGYICY